MHGAVPLPQLCVGHRAAHEEGGVHGGVEHQVWPLTLVPRHHAAVGELGGGVVRDAALVQLPRPVVAARAGLAPAVVGFGLASAAARWLFGPGQCKPGLIFSTAARRINLFSVLFSI